VRPPRPRRRSAGSARFSERAPAGPGPQPLSPRPPRRFATHGNLIKAPQWATAAAAEAGRAAGSPAAPHSLAGATAAWFLHQLATGTVRADTKAEALSARVAELEEAFRSVPVGGDFLASLLSSEHTFVDVDSARVWRYRTRGMEKVFTARGWGMFGGAPARPPSPRRGRGCRAGARPRPSPPPVAPARPSTPPRAPPPAPQR